MDRGLAGAGLDREWWAMRARRAESGLSLIEVTVVGAVAAVVLVASIGQYREFVSNQRLNAWAETIATDLRAAQQLSVARRETVVAVFAPNLYTIRIGGTDVKVGTLPPDLVSTSETVTFTTLGTTSNAGTITLRSTMTNRTKQISISSSTGRVRID
ncbi:MAG: hypothetical protein QN187_08215 [Armatimonadota bacterium]|nr:hypothetical protein [Armatimonadota bacterium]MDR7519293.1 hypothetical protein [Armatimonadota bacterium]MDR7549290.1 hypothetical protein [Armatimonadota bacterium]